MRVTRTRLALLTLIALFCVSHIGAANIRDAYPPTGEFITVNGTRLHYVEAGLQGAQTIILLHGANANLLDFAESLIPRLAEDFHILAFDRPGYGHSEMVEDPDWLDPAEQGALILEASRLIGVRDPVVLGHSWAGSVVMASLVEHPGQLKAGILLSGAAGHWAGSVGWTYDIADLPGLGWLFANTLVYPVGNFLLGGAAETVFAPNPVTTDYVERIGIPLALEPKFFLHNSRDMRLLSPYLQRLSPRYREITHPLLIVHGDADTLVPYWNHGERFLPHLPQAAVSLLPGIGHVPHHAAPEAVVASITDFIAKLPSASRISDSGFERTLATH